jgi:hypothetical protein
MDGGVSDDEGGVKVAGGLAVPPWAWAGRDLRRSVARLLLEEGRHDGPGGVGGGVPVTLRVADASVAEALAAGLLAVHRRAWHRLAAEFFEGRLGWRGGGDPAASLVLAYHWEAAARPDGTHPEPAVAAVAANHLRRAARAAAAASAPGAALGLLQRACRLLDGCDSGGPTRLRGALLREAAPCALLVFGPGSAEAVTAYRALARAVPPQGQLDSRAAAILVGCCENLAAAGKLEASAEVLPPYPACAPSL